MNQQNFSKSVALDIKNLLVIARFELVRLFLTKRGLVSLSTFAVIWYFLLRYPINLAADVVLSAEFSQTISGMFGQVGLENLLNWEVPEMAVYWVVSVFIFPLFSILITADQTCSDRSRGTLRYLCLRTSRDSIFLGRFLGQMIIMMVLIAATLIATIGLAVWKNSTIINEAIQASIIIGSNLTIVLLPFTAMMAFLSASVRSAKLATMLAIMGWGVLNGFLAWLAMKVPSTEFLSELLPGKQIIGLVKTNGWETLTYSVQPIMQMVFFLVIGRYIMKRSSL